MADLGPGGRTLLGLVSDIFRQGDRMNAQRWIARIISLVVLVATMAIGLGTAPAASAKGEDSGGKPSAADLAAPGEIAITLTTPDDGAFDGELTIYRWDPEWEYFDYYDYLEVATDSTPYETSTAVPAGDYYVQGQDYNDVYGPGLSGGATEPPGTPADPGAFTVTADEGVDTTVAMTVAAPRVAVTGLVQDTAGTPLEGIDVYTYDGPMWDGTATDTDGAYQLDLRPGTYEIAFEDYSGDHAYASTTVEVADTPVEVETVQLRPIGRRAVSGRILDSDGAGLLDAEVTLFELIDYDDDGIYDDHSYADDTYTDESGAYVLSAHEGSTYTVGARGDGHSFAVLGGGRVVQEGTPFAVDGEDVTAPDLQLAEASTLSGVVDGPGGPASYVDVELLRWDDQDEDFYYEDNTYTQESGEYSFNSLEPGFYTLYFDPSYSAEALSPAWLEGTEQPTSTTAPGVFEVTSTPGAFTKNKTLAESQVATGQLTDSLGNGLAGGSVVSYVYYEDEDYWDQYGETTTDDDGSFRARVPADSTVTFRFARGGFTPQFLGGGSSLPTTPDATNSRQTGPTGNLPLGSIALAPFDSSLGDVAGEDLPYCRDHVLPANDDGSSEPVEMPFDLRFFGEAQDTIFVNNNGNVTFGDSLSQYTPSDLTGATDLPIIAPFFADVDTGGVGSNVVTFGSSPDGTTFCVNWADVGYYSENDDRLNTFQLFLTQNETGAGRVEGDFDIKFNYDQVQWEAGDASGGSGGLGGTTAAVGFSAGSGAPGTFVQLPGSFEEGQLLDDGDQSLIGRSQNSDQDGRYIFQVRNDEIEASLGNLTGSVVDGRDSSPLGDAYVQACRTNDTGCSYTSTDSGGNYSFIAVPAGSYDIEVSPPDGLFAGGTGATVTGGETTTADPIVLQAPVPLPPNVDITSNGVGSDGVPSVYYGDPVQLQVTGCAGLASPTYTVTLDTGEVIRNALPMTESPAGTYRATITPFVPDSGAARITTTVPRTCGGAPTEFNIYIDPSGIVTDQYGRPLVGASVTLLRSDTSAGTFSMVPDGSTVMSPSNRANPSITDATGYFRWDVTTGWYKVRSESGACTTTTTPGMEVPPERIDLLITMACEAAAPTPTTGPSITGTPQVGQTITAQAATWAGPLAQTSLQLLRDGTPLPGPSHQLTAGDVGAVFTARSTGQRPDYVTEGGTGDTVTFESVQATSPGVTGVLGDAPTVTTPASITGTGKVGSTLTATGPVWSTTPASESRRWFRDATPIEGQTGATYDVVPADLGTTITVRYTASTPGYADGTATSNGILGINGDAPVATTPARATGSGRVGTTLTAVEPVWSLPGTTSTGRQWLSNGTPIAGATGATYTVTPGDVGDQIAVRFTGEKAGHSSGGSTSAPVVGSKFVSATVAKLAKAKIPTNKKGKVTITVSAPGLAAPLGAVQVKEGTQLLGQATLTAGNRGTVVVKLPKLKKGKHRLTAVYLGDALTNGSTSPTITLKVIKKKKKKRR